MTPLLAEVPPVRRDDEKQAADRERYARDDRPAVAELELWDMGRGKPDPCEKHKQESDFGEAHARLMCKTNDEIHGSIVPRRHLQI